MPSQTITYLSKKGMKELKKDITKLETRQHQAIAHLRELEKGDTHEQRLDRVEKLAGLEIIESELDDKRMLLKNAKLYPRKRDALRVAMGSVVDLIDTNGHMMRYTIVESIEANPSDGRISANSPLGKSLIGRSIEEIIEWGSGVRNSRLQLVNIS